MTNEVIQRRCRRSPTGIEDCFGSTGGTGSTGTTGGTTGGTGSTGTTGGTTGGDGLATLGFADFFALMPGDNVGTVAAGSPIDFPQDGPNNGPVLRIDASTFQILEAGNYQINWQASVSEAGQLVIAIDSGPGYVEIAQTVVGRATGTSQIVGSKILALAEGDLVQVWNPTGNPAALTITPIAGGTHAVSATLSFIKLSN